MDEWPDEELQAAEERGRIAMSTEPRAASARYEPENDRIVLDLVNGCTFAFPPRLIQGLEAATDDQLAEVDHGPLGFGLHWETLDVDISIAGLMAGRFGTARYMAGRFGPDWDALAAE